MKRDINTILEENVLLLINQGITTKKTGWENHSIVKHANKVYRTTNKELSETLKYFATIKKYVTNYDEMVQKIKNKNAELLNYYEEFMKDNAYAFARYKDKKEAEVEKSKKLIVLFVSNISTATEGGLGFSSSKEFLGTIIELISMTQKLKDWYKVNSTNVAPDAASKEKAVSKFVNEILMKLFNGEHRKIQNFYSRYFQMNRDAVYNGHPVTFRYLENEYEKVKVDISTAESKLGWSTAFFTIIISILVSVGIAFNGVHLMWLWIGLALILPCLSFFTLIWGMIHARNPRLDWLLNESKMLYLKRDENVDFDWQLEFAKANIARIMAYSKFDPKAVAHFNNASTSVMYAKEEMLHLIKQYRAIAKSKSVAANRASAITFIFPWFIITKPDKALRKELKDFNYTSAEDK